MIELMFLPFIACLILTGIHAYLGIHVVERGVIFVDLALAQIAALGSIVGFLFGFRLHSTPSYIISLLFTFIGATIFSLTRFKKKKIPQEAIIGIVYAVSAAASILALNKAPSEGEHIKYMLVGNILFVGWIDIIKMFILYSLIGLFHFIFRKNFLLISTNPAEAENRISVALWDFIFYASFGFVVTSSVSIAGVLLVFSYLIVPAVCASLFFNDLKKRLILGWIIGVITSIIGLYSSAVFDLPTGASIVVSFGGLLLFISFLKYFL